MIEVAHQRRARLTAGDMTRGAAHVDIDNIGAGSFCDPRAFSHPARFAAGELNDVRADTGGLTAQDRHRAASGKVIAGGHFRDDKPGSQLSGDTAERRIGHARHRCQKDAICDFNIANGQRCLTFRSHTDHCNSRFSPNPASLRRMHSLISEHIEAMPTL